MNLEQKINSKRTILNSADLIPYSKNSKKQDLEADAFIRVYTDLAETLSALASIAFLSYTSSLIIKLYQSYNP